MRRETQGLQLQVYLSLSDTKPEHVYKVSGLASRFTSGKQRVPVISNCSRRTRKEIGSLE